MLSKTIVSFFIIIIFLVLAVYIKQQTENEIEKFDKFTQIFHNVVKIILTIKEIIF